MSLQITLCTVYLVYLVNTIVIPLMLSSRHFLLAGNIKNVNYNPAQLNVRSYMEVVVTLRGFPPADRAVA